MRNQINSIEIKKLIEIYEYEIKKYRISEYNTTKTIEIGMLTLVINDLKKLIGVDK